MKKNILLCFLIISLSLLTSAQTVGLKYNLVTDNGFFTPADSFNSTRFWTLTGGVGGLYTGTLILLNEYWYKNYERTSFHFFNDSKEWLQMDKTGHFFNAYFISNWGVKAYEWTGVKTKKSALAGSIAGSFLLTTVELLDGFSAKWGASVADLSANLAGSGLVVAQELAWKEQRIMLKISAHPVTYSESLQDRAFELYGNTFAETVLKDYNAITIWASGNIHSFLPEESTFPKWLNIAVGYGAEGLFGGYENRWCLDHTSSIEDCSPENIVDRKDIQRYRQFYLAPDVDLSRIKTGSKVVNTLLFMANVIKFPAPALEISEKGNIKFHPVYF